MQVFLFPGQRLCKADESHTAGGRGTYSRHVFISRSDCVRLMRVMEQGKGLIPDMFLFPGQRLCKADESHPGGRGTYTKHVFISRSDCVRLMRVMERGEGLIPDVFLFPGQRLCKADESHAAGRGTYTRHVFISRSETV